MIPFRHMRGLFAVGTVLCFTVETASAEAESAHGVTVAVDWPSFLGRHDLVWEQLPRQWNEGAFTGNGQLGTMFHATPAGDGLVFHLGRADVTDHRKAPDRKTSMGTPGAGVMYDHCRLDVGRVILRPAGRIVEGSVRQDLWNAEVTAEVKTERGVLRLRFLTPRGRTVQVYEVSSTEQDEAGKPLPWQWEFHPGNPDSPRAQIEAAQGKSRGDYQSNPAPVLTEFDGIAACVQPLLAGGDYATAWLSVPGEDARSGRLIVSTANEIPAADRSGPVAAEEVRRAAAEPFEEILREHRAWWHDYYQQTFLSIPDPRLEAFYWIQMHKLASAWREDAPAIDLNGPWFRVTQWPGVWWNLNIQLTYWPVYAGNRLEIGRNYLDLVDGIFDTTFVGAAKGKTFGDYVWAMHNYWWQLRFAGDRAGLRERWAPKARQLADAFTARLVRNDAGRLGLPAMGSPEYKGFQTFDDTNYNLGLLRWLLGALIEESERDGKGDGADVAGWKSVLAEMVDFPTDANGLMIGRDQPVDMSHRHYSHLLPLYPLYVMDPDDAATRELLIRSARHWHAIEDGKALAGYSFTGGASIYASLGLGDEAHGLLDDFLDNARGGGKVLPNTFYVETAGRNPVIETPLSAASATMDLLLQSWRGKIRIFPAVPPGWSDAVFHQLRAMDGFVVSARRRDARTEWVHLRSEAGEPCIIRVADWSGPLSARSSSPVEITEITPGEYRLDLAKGNEVLLFPAGRDQPAAIVEPVPAANSNPYGVKKGHGLKEDQTWPVPARALPTAAIP
jgi:alpha-L-fucosidase 2